MKTMKMNNVVIQVVAAEVEIIKFPEASDIIRYCVFDAFIYHNLLLRQVDPHHHLNEQLPE